MYVDSLLTLSGSTAGKNFSGQDISGSSPDVSANTIDLGGASDIGMGTTLYGRFQVVISAAGGTGMEFQIITADDSQLSSNILVLGSTGLLAAALLVAGARFACVLSPRIGSRGKRYIGARYVPAGAFTAGSVFADIGLEIQDGMKFYPSGFTVS